MYRLQVLRAAEHSQPPPAHDADALCERVGFVHVVRGEHHHPPLRCLADALPDESACAHINARGGLVNKHHRRLPPSTTREQLRLLVRVLSQTVLLLHLGDGGSQRGAGVSLEPQHERQVLAQRERLPEPLQLRAEARVLEHIAQARVYRHATNRRVACARLQLASEEVDRGGLTGAVGPQQRKARAIWDGERQAIHRGHRLLPAAPPRVEVLAQPDHAHHRCGVVRTHRRDARAFGLDVGVDGVGVDVGDAQPVGVRRHRRSRRVLAQLESIEQQRQGGGSDAGADADALVDGAGAVVVRVRGVAQPEVLGDAVCVGARVLRVDGVELNIEDGDDDGDDLIGRNDEENALEDKLDRLVCKEGGQQRGQQPGKHEGGNEKGGGLLSILEGQRDEVRHQYDAGDGEQLSRHKRRQRLRHDGARRASGDGADADDEQKQVGTVPHEVASPEDAHVEAGEQEHLLGVRVPLGGEALGGGEGDDQHHEEHHERRNLQCERRLRRSGRGVGQLGQLAHARGDGQVGGEGGEGGGIEQRYVRGQ
eukprot:6184008-Pleurochrysis_carterae.AAC.2